MIDAATLAKWRKMATDATPNLEVVREATAYRLRDSEATYGEADGVDEIAQANARLWANAGPMVLRLIAELERLGLVDRRHDDYMHGYRDALAHADDFCANCPTCSGIEAELLRSLDANEEG